MKTKRARPDAGFTLAGLICLLTAVAVTTAVMVPLRAMESRRVARRARGGELHARPSSSTGCATPPRRFGNGGP